jgi:hypothetical protein
MSTKSGINEPAKAATAPREHFIPLRPAELVQKLADDPAVTIFERPQFLQFCQLVGATIHHEYHSRLEELKAAYAPFDPDGEPDSRNATVSAASRNATEGVPYSARGGFSASAEASPWQPVFDQFDDLLQRANYRRLTRDDLERALREPNHTGLRLALNLDIFQRLEVYVRGDCTTEKTTRSWRTGWREQTRQVPVHRRLAVIFRLKQATPATDPLDTRAIVLKLFKDIPRQDVETLLPGACIRIGLFEQAKIALPTLSGVGLTLFKLLKGAAAVAFVSMYGLVAFLCLVSGAIGYGLRSFHGYLRTREKHQLSLTRHLYFQNLDNNAGVIYHLLAEAEEQEFREIVLAYWLLWRGGQSGATTEQLDNAAEAWLRERWGLEVDFEISDALAKLERLGLATQARSASEGPKQARSASEGPVSSPLSPRGRGAGGEGASRYQAAPIEDALATLDRAWDACFDYRSPAENRTTAPRVWRAAA